MARTSIKYQRKTGEKITTPDIRPVLGKPLQFFLDHLKKQVATWVGKELIVDVAKIEALSSEVWNYDYNAHTGELIIFEREINYTRLRQRHHFLYSQSEALLRLSEIVKFGYLDLPDNRQVLIHLRYRIDSYPVMFSLVHNKDMQVRLSVVQLYGKKSWTAGTLFLT
jgi:hypothetical protein